MSSHKAFEVLERSTRYQGFFRIAVLRLRHTLFQGGWSALLTRELFERGDSVAVVPYDPRQDKVVLIEQFRVGAIDDAANPWLWEVVAGVVENGESLHEVARRETLEEAGCAIQHLLPIGSFYTTPGGSSEKATLYCAIVDCTGLGGVLGLAEEHEDIRVHVLDFAGVQAMLERGAINSTIPYIGLQWLAQHRERLRRDYI
ncbi:MAG: NUDIX domain-containing protein [Methylococcaceae bacterium]|nr:MAG: NUDIX domain-containing protein [Methylococcaceae bacterium]